MTPDAILFWCLLPFFIVGAMWWGNWRAHRQDPKPIADNVATYRPELEATHHDSQMALGDCYNCGAWPELVTYATPNLCEKCLMRFVPTRFIAQRDLRDFDLERRRYAAISH